MVQAPLPIPKAVSQWVNTLAKRLLDRSAQRQHQKLPRPKWHYLYYLLAAFDLLTISASLYLNHQITNIYAQSVKVNQDWATRLSHYSELGQLAAAVNSPGNDVFDSHNVGVESKRLKTSLHYFNTQVDVIRQELQTHVNEAQAIPLLKTLDTLDIAMMSMVSEANHIFSDFRQNQPEMAGRRMATMDRKYHQVNQVLNGLNQQISEIQQQVFAQQQQETDVLKKYEATILAFIVAMILSVTVYGHKLAQQVQATVKEKEKSFQQLQQVEAFLREQTTQLESSFHEVRTMQAKLVESEKMSALGGMVAGVAHEINNSVNFIHGNLKHAEEYSQDLLNLVHLYQEQYPNPAFHIQTKINEIDVDFIKKDLSNLLSSMQVGTDRICKIVKSLRSFSRLDEAEFKAANLQEGLDSTLLILSSRLQGNPNSLGINVIKNYGDLPFVDCYPAQLNQVFMNILSNAIDALDDSFAVTYGSGANGHLSSVLNNATPYMPHGKKQKPTGQMLQHKGQKTIPTIHIRTEVLPYNFVSIRISDNGPGIPKDIHSKIFNPFFTTKLAGKRTGLGLFTSYKIVVEEHGGRLQCYSEPGQGTEFVIEIPILQAESQPLMAHSAIHRSVDLSGHDRERATCGNLGSYENFVGR
jgi:two-component system, NtrC family, sensor kinase